MSGVPPLTSERTRCTAQAYATDSVRKSETLTARLSWVRWWWLMRGCSGMCHSKAFGLGKFGWNRFHRSGHPLAPRVNLVVGSLLP